MLLLYFLLSVLQIYISLEPSVYQKQPPYPNKGRVKAYMHPTLPRTHLWDYTVYDEFKKFSDNTS